MWKSSRAKPSPRRCWRGGVARQWSRDGDLVFSGGLFLVGQGGVAGVDEMLGWQQAATGSSLVEVFQEPDGIVSGGKDPGLGLAGVPAQADWPPIAASPVLVDQLVQQVRGCAGNLFRQCG